MRKVEDTDIYYNSSDVFSKQVDPELDNEVEEFYTLNGLEDKINNGHNIILDKNSPNVFAKKILRKNGTFKFLVKTNQQGKLYNPVSIYGQETTKTFLDKVCRSNDKFVEVNLKTFNYYIQFLDSKNISWLNNAERERE